MAADRRGMGALALAVLLAVVGGFAPWVAQARADAEATPLPDGVRRIEVMPSHTDPRIQAFDVPHHVQYVPDGRAHDLLIFLVGTTEKPGPGPREFLRTALDQGYRVLTLAYISYPAVAQVCAQARLRSERDCAAHFRQRRVYGDGEFDGIPDQPHDAIVPRLVKLLETLSREDPEGDWGQYLRDGRPAWDRIAVSGQSQGGGMAQYLGKREALARVLSFSGGWDNASPDEIAAWYAQPAVTPPERWFYAYHVLEPQAARLARIGEALGVPADQVFALDLPLGEKARKGRQPGHGSSIGEAVYRPVWIRMLGSGVR